MKRFLIALAVGALAVFGSANAALLNFFEFGDAEFGTSSLFAITPVNSTLHFLQNPTTSSGLNPWEPGGNATLSQGLKVINTTTGPGGIGLPELTYGDVVYDSATANVSFVSALGAKPSASGTLPGGTFALALFSGNDWIPLRNIAAVDGVRGSYLFEFKGGSWARVGDVTAIPIPAAGLLFLSAIGGLLLLARRNRARHNSAANRVGEPLPA